MQISTNDNNWCDNNAPAAMWGAKMNKVWMQRSNDLCDAIKWSTTTRHTQAQQYDMMGGTNNEGAKWSIKKLQQNYMRAQCNNMKQDDAELEIETMRGKAEVIWFFLKVLCTGLLSYKRYTKRDESETGCYAQGLSTITYQDVGSSTCTRPAS